MYSFAPTLSLQFNLPEVLRNAHMSSRQILVDPEWPALLIPVLFRSSGAVAQFSTERTDNNYRQGTDGNAPGLGWPLGEEGTTTVSGRMSPNPTAIDLRGGQWRYGAIEFRLQRKSGYPPVP